MQIYAVRKYIMPKGTRYWPIPREYKGMSNLLGCMERPPKSDKTVTYTERDLMTSSQDEYEFRLPSNNRDMRSILVERIDVHIVVIDEI